MKNSLSHGDDIMTLLSEGVDLNVGRRSPVRITVGIPAYNEKKNIGILLRAIGRQNIESGLLDSIIVISDGSDDGTGDEVRAVGNPRITLIEHGARRGIAATQNELIKHAKGEVLVLLNADILPRDEKFIDTIVAPILSDPSVGIVGATIKAATPKGWFERIIARSHEFKNALYLTLNNEDSIYLCHGRARAFSRAFYTRLTWPDDCPEDSFSYLMAHALGFSFVYERKAEVYFRSPRTLKDHVKQSRRYLEGRKRLERRFDAKLVGDAHRIPWQNFIRTFGVYVSRYPLDIILYVGVSAYVYFLAPRTPIDQTRWDISITSKQVFL